VGRRPARRLPLRPTPPGVETDGYQYHRTRRAFERDRERDAILARAGYRMLRFTRRQLTREPAMVADTVRSWA
jgi:very-short-patch-repair endonuclease